MDTIKLTNQLQQMKGKFYKYASQVHAVIDFTLDEEKFEIMTNIGRYPRKHESAEEFLKYWVPVEHKEAVIINGSRETAITNEHQGGIIKNENIQMDVYFEQEKSEADDLIKILKANITKVQGDANYIPQAQAVNDNVNSIINIQKMKLEYFKSFRKN